MNVTLPLGQRAATIVTSISMSRKIRANLTIWPVTPIVLSRLAKHEDPGKCTTNHGALGNPISSILGELALMQRNKASYADKSYAIITCNRLRLYREESGFSASDVAEHLNMPTVLYVVYEENELVPHRLISPLCKFLNISPWFYLTGRSNGQSPPVPSGSAALSD